MAKMPGRRTVLSALVCLSCAVAVHLSIYSRHHRAELIGMPDAPGFQGEAENQVASGAFFDDVGAWDTPGNFNNRGLADLFQSKMDAGMTNDAVSSGFYDTGPTDFSEPSSMVYSPEDNSELLLDNSYNNAWPGTGSGIYSFEDIAANTDSYDGEWNVLPQEAEAADSPAVSGLKSRQQQLIQVPCTQCYGGEKCVAGCKVDDNHNRLAKRSSPRKDTPSLAAPEKHARTPKPTPWLQRAIMGVPLVRDFKNLAEAPPMAGWKAFSSAAEGPLSSQSQAAEDPSQSEKDIAQKYGVSAAEYQAIQSSPIAADPILAPAGAAAAAGHAAPSLAQKQGAAAAAPRTLQQKAAEPPAAAAAAATPAHAAHADPNFSLEGYWPVDGRKAALEEAGVTVDSSPKADPNLSVEGYWPLDGGSERLERAGVVVVRPLAERPMPEQPGGITHFFDAGDKLKRLGVHVA